MSDTFHVLLYIHVYCRDTADYYTDIGTFLCVISRIRRTNRYSTVQPSVHQSGKHDPS